MSIQSLYSSITGAAAQPAGVDAQIKLKVTILKQFAGSQFASLAGDAINAAELAQAETLVASLDRMTDEQKNDFLASLNEMYSKAEKAVLQKLVSGAAGVSAADLSAITAAAQPEPEPTEPAEEPLDLREPEERTQVEVTAASASAQGDAATALVNLLQQLLS